MTVFKQITIVGVGLIGGSLGKALKEKKLCDKVVGVVRRKKAIIEVLAANAADLVTTNLEEGVRDADLVVLGMPVSDILANFKLIAPFLKKGAIVTDVGSVKGNIVLDAQKAAGENVFFVGSHPIAGSEKQGVKYAQADLFANTVCVITPTSHTNKAALHKVVGFWEQLAVTVKVISLQDHDRMMAYTSHLPHLAAVCLVNSVLSKRSFKRNDYVGSGFKDTTRIASSNHKIWLDICTSNQKEIVIALENYRKELDAMINTLKHNKWRRLTSFLKNAKALRDKIKL